MWIVGEDATQIAIVNSGPLEVVTLAFATIVIAQRSTQCRQWIDLRARSVLRLRAREIGHQLVDILELLQRRPAVITTSPLRARRQPNGKRLGEVFRGMRLRVPGRQVQDILATLRFRLVEVGIRLRERAEELAMLAFEVETERC